MTSTQRRAVALAIRHPDAMGLVLGVRRPDDPEDELAGVWGLPAATLAEGETEADAVRRLAREKLGLELQDIRLLRSGAQTRPTYRLSMGLYEALVLGEPRLPPPESRRSDITYYTGWRWMPARGLTEASNKGSLCARLYLDEVRASRLP